jgi:hypothetical protein
MNAHQKQGFLMRFVVMCIKNQGFLNRFGRYEAPRRYFGTPHIADPRTMARKQGLQPAAICATASHKFQSCNAALHLWPHALSASLSAELDRVSQTLTRRIRELAERYATPLPALADEVEALSAKVGEHLAKMGVVWN